MLTGLPQVALWDACPLGHLLVSSVTAQVAFSFYNFVHGLPVQVTGSPPLMGYLSLHTAMDLLDLQS